MATATDQLTTTMVLAPLPLTERGYNVHLGGTTKIRPRIVYGNEALCIQRFLDNTNDCRINMEHAVKVNCAKFHPNGQWVASGDDSGLVKVWAHESMVVKNEINAARQVKDISWSADGQRLFAVGAGKDEKAKVFPWNTNNKLGEISGAPKGFTACDFKPTRPFRIAAACEDLGVYFYKGPPFQFESCTKPHRKYPNVVRFTPDGNFYISAGQRMFVFDGRSGEQVREVADEANGHSGSIYALAFSPDGQQFITASADRTCKIWDFETGQVVHTFSFSDEPTLGDMQVGVLWMEGFLISLSLSGRLNFLDPAQERPVRVLTGHRASITDCALDRENGRFFSGDADGRVVMTECKTGEMFDFTGPQYDVAVKLIDVSSDGAFVMTVGVNDTVKRNSVENMTYSDAIRLEGAARFLSCGKTNPNLTVVGTHRNKLYVLNELEIQCCNEIGYAPVAGCLSPDDSKAYVCGEDYCIYVYDIAADGNMTEVQKVENASLTHPATTVVASPDGRFIATADKNRNIWVWDVNNFAEPINLRNSYRHHASVPTTLDWSPDSSRLVSAGHDLSIIVWTTAGEGTATKLSHQGVFSGAIKTVRFLDNTKLIGGATDCTIRFVDING